MAKGLEVIKGGDVKTVNKPWGYEKWMATGEPNFPYAYKIIHIKAPHKTSLQFHAKKQESNLLVEGKAVLHYHDEPVDIPRYEAGGYTDEEIQKIISGVKTRPITAGTLINIWPGYIHRIEAVDEDITLMEASSTELDDVYRLQDDSNRADGKIKSEHE